jgi:hypothetical protein
LRSRFRPPTSPVLSARVDAEPLSHPSKVGCNVPNCPGPADTFLAGDKSRRPFVPCKNRRNPFLNCPFGRAFSCRGHDCGWDVWDRTARFHGWTWHAARNMANPFHLVVEVRAPIPPKSSPISKPMPAAGSTDCSASRLRRLGGRAKDRNERARIRKACQDPLCGAFLGRPRGVRVLSRFILAAVIRAQASEP